MIDAIYKSCLFLCEKKFKQGCQHWMRVRSEKCEGRPLPAYKVAQVPKKLMSGGGGGGGTPTLFF